MVNPFRQQRVKKTGGTWKRKVMKKGGGSGGGGDGSVPPAVRSPTEGAEDGWQCHRNGTGRVMKTEGQEGCDGPL